MKIIIPKTLVEIEPTYGPLFFLAGPLQGGDDWQRKCCAEICKHMPDSYVAIPYYDNKELDFPLMRRAVDGSDVVGYLGRQLDWERYYLARAAKHGCIIFWLPKESKEKPRTSGAYASATRGEIARWSVELKYNPHYRIVVGAEPEFPDLSEIHRNFIADQYSSVQFYSTLAETVAAALKKVS